MHQSHNKKNDKENKSGLRQELARFLEKRQGEKSSEFMNDLVSEHKFIADEMKMRSMVEEILKKDFSPEITGLKSYNLLVDAVINKLKKDQNGKFEDDEKFD